MLRSEFLAAVPLTLFILACGEEDPGSIAADAGAGGNSGAPPSGGAGAGGSGGSGGSTAGTGGVGGRCGTVTGGASSTAGTGTGGSSTAGEPSVGGTGGAGAVGGGAGSAGSAALPPECAGLDASVGGIALPPDFSMSEGVAHEHTLSMNRGSMVRRQLDYQTTGSDHQHQILFTDEQLIRLMAGETIVVETEGPPLNASSGHSHTVTVHPCQFP